MPNRAALVTGASRGIGRAVAETLGEEGFALTLTARRAGPLEQTAAELRERGMTVACVAANLAEHDAVATVVEVHRRQYGRLDVLVNNAGVGIGAAATEHEPRLIDMQLGVNVRSTILFYQECAGLLREAGAEHRNALVINMASLAGKSPQPWLSVYSATKAAVIAYAQAMNIELGPAGVKSVALCPGFVDTDMSEFIKGRIPAQEMLRTSDIAAAVRFLLRLSPACVVPEIVLARPGEAAL